MEERETTRTVAQVVGQNMRRLRESRAKVLHDVASAARDLGLTWDASAVSRIETGRRDLTLDEFLALPLVMTLALNDTVTMVDLLQVDIDRDVFVKSFERTPSILNVLAMLAEPYVAFVKPQYADKPGESARPYLEAAKVSAQVAREPAEERSSYREMQALADEFDVRVKEVMAACSALWGEHTLSPSGERERRLRNSGADLSNPASVRTLRGHITRQLTAELRDHFATKETRHVKR
jgi:hypothetical protein